MESLSEKLKLKTKKCATLLVILVVLFPACSYAQADIHFSQFYETSILRNPALTGVFEADYKFGAYYRNQWSSITNPYQTALVSGEYRLSVGHRGYDYCSFGLLGYTDKAGSIDQRITGVYPAINYNKSLNKDHNTYLSVGFTGGYLQYSFDPEKATFNNQFLNGHFSPSNPTLENLPYAKMSLYDMGAGINFNTSKGEDNKVTYMAGFAGYHFTQPEFSYYNAPGITQNIRWNVNAAMSSTVSESVGISIHFNYAVQATYKELMIGGLLNWTADKTAISPMYIFSFGLFYRYGDAIIPVVKIKYKNLAWGFSYDVNVSSLTPASYMQGGFEVTMFVTGTSSGKSGVIKKMMCPKF